MANTLSATTTVPSSRKRCPQWHRFSVAIQRQCGSERFRPWPFAPSDAAGHSMQGTLRPDTCGLHALRHVCSAPPRKSPLASVQPRRWVLGPMLVATHAHTPSQARRRHQRLANLPSPPSTSFQKSLMSFAKLRHYWNPAGALEQLPRNEARKQKRIATCLLVCPYADTTHLCLTPSPRQAAAQPLTTR
jgi:hypothetical protein